MMEGDEVDKTKKPQQIQPTTTSKMKGTAGMQDCQMGVHSFAIFLVMVPFLIITWVSFYGNPALRHDKSSVSKSVEESIVKKIRYLYPISTIHDGLDMALNETVKKLLDTHIASKSCNPQDFQLSILEQQQNDNISDSNDESDQQDLEPPGGLSKPQHFVIYIAVGLLLTSLLVAVIDVYKTKGKPSKIKPQLTKRCSLADLTVLRHSRRESMRKDSLADELRSGGSGGSQKLQGTTYSTVVYRRSSHPAYSTGGPRVSAQQPFRKVSLDFQQEMYSYDTPHNHVVRIIRRF